MMMYADDSQLYIIVKRSNRSVGLEQLELCVDDVLHWNIQNSVTCNPTKTEVIHFYSGFTQTDSISQLRVGNAIIKPVTEVSDLGVTFDSTLSLHNHINNICRSGSLSLHQIGKIKKLITQEYAEKIVHAFVS